jgi:hypothetical protein
MSCIFISKSGGEGGAVPPYHESGEPPAPSIAATVRDSTDSDLLVDMSNHFTTNTYAKLTFRPSQAPRCQQQHIS